MIANQFYRRMVSVVLLVGIGAIAITALGRLSRASEADSEMMLHVRSGRTRMRVTNDGAQTWHSCVIRISGGYGVQLDALPPRHTVSVRFSAFQRGASQLWPVEGFARAFRDTLITCENASDRSVSE